MAGGKPPEDLELQDGFFIEPTSLTGVDNNMTVTREEIFGLVLSVISIESEEEEEEEFVRRANDTPYSLTAAVWAKDVQRLTESLTPSRSAWAGSTLTGPSPSSRPSEATWTLGQLGVGIGDRGASRQARRDIKGAAR